MQELKYEFDVKRDISFVFNNIYKEDIFRIWSASFSKDSHYEGEIVEGAKIEFLDADKNGIGGTVGRIIPNEYLEFLMAYEIFDGVNKDIEEPGAEKYYFSKVDDNTTHVIIRTTVPDDYVDMMNEMWPKGIKDIISTLENL